MCTKKRQTCYAVSTYSYNEKEIFYDQEEIEKKLVGVCKHNN